MRTERYDVAIIGAGPAGAVFARELSRLCPSLSVLLVDGSSRELPKCCGGLLAPDAQKAFAEFDMTLPGSILADPQIFTVETIDLFTEQERYYQRHYLNMDRYRFERWLISLVPESVSLISDRVRKIERSGKDFVLTLKDRQITAASIVGADGSGSIVRRALGKKYPRQYISIQEWYKNDGQAMPYYSCIFDPETSDSCSWTIHKDGYIIFGGAFEKKGCREAFEKQKARLESFTGEPLGESERREACLLSSPRCFSDLWCGEPGAYLLGEAAGFISSSSFEGISSAMISAKALAKAFAGASSHKKIIRAYRKNTLSLRLKLCTKMLKRALLCTPLLRHLIMLSGIASVKVEKKGRKV